VLSNLGTDQFDEEDQRVLEILATHAGVAYENASLLQKERRAAETSSALLGLSQALTGARDTSTVLERVVDAVPSILSCSSIATYHRDPETGDFVMLRKPGVEHDREAHPTPIPGEVGSRFIAGLEGPFVITEDVAAQVPAGFRLEPPPREVLVAPLRWEPDELGALVMAAPEEDGSFSEHERSLARGISHIASLALGSARRVSELERFKELAQTLDAIFWEAEPATLRFTFLSQRAGGVLRPAGSDQRPPEHWGDHVHPEDRARALRALRSAIEAPGEDLDLEYRAPGVGGRTLWLRDIVHVSPDALRGPVVRGLIVDVTQGKRAEQALRRSEQKYSEAFHREREATQRLRALDEMKNTFLEAVSHDLRTPLTSILGSAVTLEQAGMRLPEADAMDLLRRIASNARKLERLLSDLLDLDRLQRGIMTPQRRETDVGSLVRGAVKEFELFGGREVEVSAEEIVASIDAAKVERIVENLLVNAARHTPAASRIWVRAMASGDGVLIVVEDDGTGVPDELKEAVFEPFRQGPGPASTSPGVGVGLSLVARFAELHGGRAWVEDRPGGGASFHVFISER
jgi:signal transduction histidine kinase